MRVAQPMRVDASVDARPDRQAFEHHADVNVGHRLAAERAEDGVAAAGADGKSFGGIEMDARSCGAAWRPPRPYPYGILPRPGGKNPSRTFHTACMSSRSPSNTIWRPVLSFRLSR
jgi:hypothetical protein